MKHSVAWYAGDDLAPSDFIYPLFVVEGRDRREEIVSMPDSFGFPSTSW